ncbi:ATP-binding protein [Lactiplantibacillus carotarum]|uniref:ATP-binding protein n=1 Tax=Lactiplantibacillus carotarum TaxID=2993456 RepID=UPI00298F13CE|nr:ATP-binding protein [Lactiplantibacillus carotarum]
MLSERPVLPNFSHPVEEGHYLFLTTQIAKMCNQINIWIQNRIPGAIIYGRPRLGKTAAINFAQRYLGNLWKNRADFYYMTTNTYTTLTERIFFEEMLRSVGHEEIAKGTIVEKRMRVMNTLITNATILNVKKVVFFIDEAQRLTEKQYNWLMDIYNELYANGITLTTILIGQPELQLTRTSYFKYKTMIRERFMTEIYEFHGLLSIKDIQVCLEQYDIERKYPTDSEWTFTRYYFPSQFENGFRIGNYSKSIYDAFWKVQQKNSKLRFLKFQCIISLCLLNIF